jgi:hypothetical protein
MPVGPFLVVRVFSSNFSAIRSPVDWQSANFADILEV